MAITPIDTIDTGAPPKPMPQTSGNSSPSSNSRPSLLQLTPETTMMILRHLLRGDQPLDGRSVDGHRECQDHFWYLHTNCWAHDSARTFVLHPEILRTCKRLYREGVSILYHENIIRLHMFHDIVTEFALLEQGQELDTLDLDLTAKFSRLEIGIHTMQHGDKYMDSNIMFDLLMQIGKFCRLLDKSTVTRDKHLIIAVDVLGKTGTAFPWPPHEWQESEDRSSTEVVPFLSSFQILRCKSVHVVLNGDQVTSIPEWATAMTSDSEVVDLVEMGARLETFCNECNVIKDHDSRVKFMEAMKKWDLNEFLDAREEIIAEIQEQFEERVSRCYGTF